MSQTLTSNVLIRLAVPADKPAIDRLRHKHNGGFPLIDDPEVKYTVCERDGVITAICGIKRDPTSLRALVVDLYGTRADDWSSLKQSVLDWADLMDMELSAWVSVTNRRLKTFLRDGFTTRAVLIRREAQ